jgi:thiopeptide-type bacteriocin biosynthesis protein
VTIDAEWISLHVYGAPDEDELLLGCVEPCLRAATRQRLVDGFFFVRYWNGGRHIRLRARPTSAAQGDSVRATLVEAIHAHLAAHPPVAADPEAYRRAVDALALGELHGEPVLPLVAPGTVREELYHFEDERYAGRAARAPVELHFCDSSALALMALRRVGRRARATWALHALVAGAAALSGGLCERARFFAAWHRAAWSAPAFAGRRDPRELGYRDYGEVRDGVRAAVLASDPDFAAPAASAPAPTWRGAWRASVASALRSVTAAGGQPAIVLASLLHMLCNRLSLPQADEAFASWVLARAYAELATEFT